MQELHDGMTGQVLHRGTTSPLFPIQTGVKQGCVLAVFFMQTLMLSSLRDLMGMSSTPVDYAPNPDVKISL